MKSGVATLGSIFLFVICLLSAAQWECLLWLMPIYFFIFGKMEASLLEESFKNYSRAGASRFGFIAQTDRQTNLTRELKAFRLRAVEGAFKRGDE